MKAMIKVFIPFSSHYFFLRRVVDRVMISLLLRDARVFLAAASACFLAAALCALVVGLQSSPFYTLLQKFGPKKESAALRIFALTSTGAFFLASAVALARRVVDRLIISPLL